jgi:hypothetical protein
MLNRVVLDKGAADAIGGPYKNKQDADIDLIFKKDGTRRQEPFLKMRDGRWEGEAIAKATGVPIINTSSTVHESGPYKDLPNTLTQWVRLPEGQVYYSKAQLRFFIKGLEDSIDPGYMISRRVGNETLRIPHGQMFIKREDAGPQPYKWANQVTTDEVRQQVAATKEENVQKRLRKSPMGK